MVAFRKCELPPVTSAECGFQHFRTTALMLATNYFMLDHLALIWETIFIQQNT